MHCTDPIWRVQAASNALSSWTPLKHQLSKPNRNPLANQLWCIDFLTPPTTFIIPHRLPAFLECLIPLKNWCSIHARWSKSNRKPSICFCGIFSKFKTAFYCISFFYIVLTSWLHFLNLPTVTSRVYSNYCCTRSFEPEIIKIGQSSYEMYSINILNYQVSTTILNACTKKSRNILNTPRISVFFGNIYMFPARCFRHRICLAQV